MNNTSLAGQVALVTGASQGIGLHLAQGLAAHGMTIVGLARRAEPLTEAMESVAARFAVPTLAVAADVTRTEHVERAVTRALKHCGPLDLVVNAAGLVDAAEVPAWEADPDQWWSVVESHIRGAHLIARAVVPGMVDRGQGRIVNLASGMGTRAEPDYSAYSVGKAGQIRFTEALAEALRGTGVFAFNIAPGLVRTQMTAGMPKWEGHTAWTPPERVVELVCSVAVGELDAWAGRFLRAGVDRVDVIRSMVPEGASRQLRLRAYSPDDPVA